MDAVKPDIERLRDYDRIIIGIDPGTNVMGYGILGVNGKTPQAAKSLR